MTRFLKPVFAVLIGLASSLATAPVVSAADLQSYVYESDPGVCGESWVLNRITNRFRYQVTHVPHLEDVSIVDFRGIHENRYLPAREDRPIGRRYCGATVALSNGRDRMVWYLIEEGQGFASIGNNVEFCVAGFDRWLVYNGRCRILR